ncbi:FtsK/SpoIIIE domain-containing protein [Streptococcus ferus]|uniref:FtsK/SpoIIIE domain-containing protein n=1 Tax=Streptococcus ferus TaxID=1345 RepID=UPI0035A078A8
MRKVNANWVYPFTGSILSCILSVVMLILMGKYVNPYIIQYLGHQYNIYFVLFCVLAAFIFTYGLSHRKLYQNRQKLYKFIKTNKLFTIEKDSDGREHIIDSVEMEWIESDDTIIVRVFKEGGPLDEKIGSLGERLESFLKMRLLSLIKKISYIDYVFEKTADSRIILTNESHLSKQDNTTIQLTQKISYDISKVSHGLTVGKTGSGKSFFINSKILAYAQMGAEIFICDPKNADLSLIKFIKNFPEDHVATTSNQICKVLRIVHEIMNERYSKYFNDVSSFGKTFKDFELKPIVIIFDEYASFIKSCDKKLSQEAIEYIYSIVMKGRQMGCSIEFILQRPDTNILDGAIRDQLGCRVALSNMSSEGYKMIFGSNNCDFQPITVKGGGYIMIDGLHKEPIYFETPLLSEGFDFIQELSKYY